MSLFVHLANRYVLSRCTFDNNLTCVCDKDRHQHFVEHAESRSFLMERVLMVIILLVIHVYSGTSINGHSE